MKYDEAVIRAFLEKQLQLFPEPVADDPEEAQEFLEDDMAVVCKNIRQVRACLDEAGMDVSGMSDEELTEASEVFSLADGRFLVL